MSAGARGGVSAGTHIDFSGKPRGGHPDGLGEGALQPITWARLLPIGPAEKAVLMHLVLLLGQYRKDPYPSAQTLESWTGFSLRKVRDALANLQRLGLITAQHRRGAGGRQGSNSYKLHVGKMVTREDFESLAQTKRSKPRGSAAAGQSAGDAPWGSRASVQQGLLQGAPTVAPACTTRTASMHAVHPREVKSEEEGIDSDDGIASARHRASGSALLRPSPKEPSAPAWPVAQWQGSEQQRALTQARRAIEQEGASYVDWLRQQAKSMKAISGIGALVLEKGAGYLPRLAHRPSDSDARWQSHETWPCSLNGDLMVPHDQHALTFFMAKVEADLLATVAFTLKAGEGIAA